MPWAFLRKHRWPLIVLGSAAVLIAVFALGFFAHDASVSTTVGLADDLAPLAPSTSARVIADKEVARTIFGDVCNGDVSVSVASLSNGRAGLSSWTLAGEGERYENCTIIVSSEKRWSDGVLCAIVVHEYGHLAGVSHSTNPRSVMYPRLSSHNIPDRCL